MACPRVGGMVHVGAAIWRVHDADGSPVPGGPATLAAAARGLWLTLQKRGPDAYSGQSEFKMMSTKLPRL
jgi:hypothetical protein